MLKNIQWNLDVTGVTGVYKSLGNIYIYIYKQKAYTIARIYCISKINVNIKESSVTFIIIIWII